MDFSTLWMDIVFLARCCDKCISLFSGILYHLYKHLDNLEFIFSIKWWGHIISYLDEPRHCWYVYWGYRYVRHRLQYYTVLSVCWMYFTNRSVYFLQFIIWVDNHVVNFWKTFQNYQSLLLSEILYGEANESWSCCRMDDVNTSAGVQRMCFIYVAFFAPCPAHTSSLCWLSTWSRSSALFVLTFGWLRLFAVTWPLSNRSGALPVAEPEGGLHHEPWSLPWLLWGFTSCAGHR